MPTGPRVELLYRKVCHFREDFLWGAKASDYSLHASDASEATRVRIPGSPSPQPSPLGRGRTIPHRSTNQGPRNRRTRAQGRSLSPRERVGVRGKQVCERELASEEIVPR